MSPAADQSLNVSRYSIIPSRDPFSHYVGYDPGATSGLDGHPEGGLRIVIPFMAPKVPATRLAMVEGQFKIKIGNTVEEIEIPDLRMVANQPLEPPSLRAAGAKLWIRSGTFNGQSQEALEFAIGPNHAVGPLEVQSSRGVILFEPDYAVDPNGQHFSTRNRLDGLPDGPLTMTFKLYSDIEEITVPFRFENVPLPSLDKKPKQNF